MEAIEAEIRDVLLQIYQVRAQRLEKAADLIATRGRLMEQLDEVDDAIANRCLEEDQQFAALEARARGLGMRLEQTVKTRYGMVNFTAGYERCTYSAKKLNALIETRSELKWLLEYRQCTSVAPKVRVQICDTPELGS